MIAQWKNVEREPAPAGHPLFVLCEEANQTRIHGPVYYVKDPSSGDWGWYTDGFGVICSGNVVAWDFWPTVPANRKIEAQPISETELVGRVLLKPKGIVYIEFLRDNDLKRLDLSKVRFSSLLDIGTDSETLLTSSPNLYWTGEGGSEEQLIIANAGCTWRAWDGVPTSHQRSELAWW